MGVSVQLTNCLGNTNFNNERWFAIEKVVMVQVLKPEIRDRMLVAAMHVFYDKGFREARMADIAAQAEVSTSLLYSYFKNKSELFDAVIADVPTDFEQIAIAEEQADAADPLGRYLAVTHGYLQVLLTNHRAFVILMDKSQGSIHEGAKSKLISAVEAHIGRSMARCAAENLPALLPHVLANNFVEGLLEVARHFENEAQAMKLLDLIMQCYYEGVNSL